MVTDDATFLIGRRVPATAALTPEVDQFSLAGIAYQWMFGRPVAGPADRPVAVRAIPGVEQVGSRTYARTIGLGDAKGLLVVEPAAKYRVSVSVRFPNVPSALTSYLKMFAPLLM